MTTGRINQVRTIGGLRARRAPPAGRPGASPHARTGGEEECTGTADTNPGCNYLVRGYSPSMQYFWRGDMPHFSSPLPFQRGARGCRAAAVPRPPRMARRRPRPARAGQSRSRAAAVRPGAVVRALHFGRDGTPGRRRAADTLADGGPARHSPHSPSSPGRDRRNLKLARRTRRGPAAASANPPSPAVLPHFHTTFDSAHNAILR